MTDKSILKTDKKTCTGCGVCESACPKGCIRMLYDEEGFSYPSVDTESCIGCGICLKACHTENAPAFHTARSAYAVSGKEKGVYKGSASGGAFALIARAFIEKKDGIVFGACMDREGRVRHKSFRSKDSVPALQGSKYVQSDTSEVWHEIKDLLEDGKSVLFSGTGCQAAALKTYLGKDYDNLYIVDLICHGVPSPVFLAKHLESAGFTAGAKVLFRQKASAGEVSRYCLRIEKDGKAIYDKDGEEDPYMSLFMHGMSFRECCYGCRYAKRERAGDLSIGDIRPDCISDEDAAALTSFTGLLPNTRKGTELVRSLADADVEMHQADLDKYVETNRRLTGPAERPAERDLVYERVFFKPYDADNLKDLIPLQPKKTLKKRIKRFIPVSVQKMFK